MPDPLGPTRRSLAALAFVLAACATGCAATAESDGSDEEGEDTIADEEAIKYTSSPNGWRCIRSKYNCAP